MSERIRGSYDDALYKSTYTLVYFSLVVRASDWRLSGREFDPRPPHRILLSVR